MGTTVTGSGRTRLECTLFPIPQSPSSARTFVRRQLVSLGYEDLVYNACQITSELVTNAVHAVITANLKTDSKILLHLGPNKGRPLLEVWDSSPEMPVTKAEDLYAESGRGLLITQTLAAQWGYYPKEGGKTVWALLK